MGQRLGEADDPLLVSVRSGAKFSMPGMMETVLNIGLNDESVQGLAKQAGSERFAWDSYRRLIQMFGKTVLDIDGRALRGRHRGRQEGPRHHQRPRPRRSTTCAASSTRSRASSATRPAASSRRTRASRWTSRSAPSSTPGTRDRAILYRRQERIPADLGTAVNICSMVFGNLGMDSGTGVAFTRDPGSGQQGIYGDYLQNAQGEDVVAGIRNTRAAAGPRGHRQAVLRPAAGHHGDAGEPLPRPVRHRVHDRARQAVDAADPGRQAHRGCRLPDRHPAGRRGPDRPGRGAAAG